MKSSQGAERRESAKQSQLIKISQTIRLTAMRRLRLRSFAASLACAVAGLVLLLWWPAAAQTVICDSDFLISNWDLRVFACPAGTSGNTSVVAQQSPGGSTAALGNPQPPATCPLNGNFREVRQTLTATPGAGCPTNATTANSLVYGVHTFNGPGGSYNPAVSGEIASIDFQIDYQCPGPEAGGSAMCQAAGHAFGPALIQGGNSFVASGAGVNTQVGTTWKRSNSTSLPRTAFNQISQVSGNTFINTGIHPDFSATAPSPINCGFYTANSRGDTNTFVRQAGYDNWSCRITPVGTLKVCKVAGPGIAVGTPFSFTANGTTFQVPAGPAPGGTCVVVTPNPGFAVGTTVNIVETPIPAGVAVSSIAVAVASPGNVVSTTLATGTASVVLGPGVTEVTFTDYRTTGFLEICKTGVTGGSFMVTPGNLGPFAVPVGACSPAIQVTAGRVDITETPNTANTNIDGCTTIPAGRVLACPPGGLTAAVTVVPGDIPSQTIVTVNNR
jgi:hypothetical protein